VITAARGFGVAAVIGGMQMHDASFLFVDEVPDMWRKSRMVG
jgi:hypothetical protein